jgi:hypothetical protein
MERNSTRYDGGKNTIKLPRYLFRIGQGETLIEIAEGKGLIPFDCPGPTATPASRPTTKPETLDLQLDTLKASGCEVCYQEHASGKSVDRPELESALKALRTGDALVVWRLDRLGRRLADLVRIVNDLEGRDVGLVSLTEQINTTSPSGKLVFHLFASLADGIALEFGEGSEPGPPARCANTSLDKTSLDLYGTLP